MDFDDVRLALPVRIPEVFAQHPARDDLSGVSQEILQQTELCRSEIDIDSGPLNTTIREIQ